MRFDDVVARLRAVRWGSAAAWDPAAAAWLRAYYQRLLPWWPPDRARLAPNDHVIEDAARAALTDDDRARIATETETLWTAARGRGERVEATTSPLVGFVLAWALHLEEDHDPGVPLLDLFAAGFQIHYTDAGIELHHAGGWMTAPVPTRASLTSTPIRTRAPPDDLGTA